jgi:hypothetical protein
MKLLCAALCVVATLAQPNPPSTHYDAPTQICKHTACKVRANLLIVTHKNSNNATNGLGTAHHGPAVQHPDCAKSSQNHYLCGASEQYSHTCSITDADAGTCECTCGEACRDAWQMCGVHSVDELAAGKPTCCKRGLTCMKKNDVYHQCRPSGTEASLAAEWFDSPSYVAPPAQADERCFGNPNGDWGAEKKPTTCVSGYTCFKKDASGGPNGWYGQCKPDGWTPPATWIDSPNYVPPCANAAGASAKCKGGAAWTGDTCCSDGESCIAKSDVFGQCKPPTFDVPVEWDAYVAPAAQADERCFGNPNGDWAAEKKPTTCVSGYTCFKKENGPTSFYGKCKPDGWTVPNTWIDSPNYCASVAGDRCLGGSSYTGGTCCPDGMTCFHKDDYYGQCRRNDWAVPADWKDAPPTSAPTTPPTPACTDCDDVAAPWMVNQDKDCTAIDTQNKAASSNFCRNSVYWVNPSKQYCRKTCFHFGQGYQGDNCCA